MDDLKVQVIEVTDLDQQQESVDLNATKLKGVLNEVTYNQFLKKLRGAKTRTFLLIWQGAKSPTGAKILDHVIGWTQNGIVYNETGKEIGTYDRVIEYGGESKRQQIMIAYPFVIPNK